MSTISWNAELGNFFSRNPDLSGTKPSDLYVKFGINIEFPDPANCLGSLILAERSATVCARRRSVKYFKDRVQWVFSMRRKNVSSQLVFN